LAVGFFLRTAGLLHAQGVYSRVAPATVLFYDGTGWGSGALIDAEQRLVVTAEHVVRRAIRGGDFKVRVMFPQLGKGQKVNTNGAFYKKKKDALQIAGEVVYFDRTKDLALVRLDRLPPGVKGVPLALADPSPGDRIHVVGNSTFGDGGAFSYCTGTVRNQYYFDRPTVVVAGAPCKDKVFFALSHHAPTNRGDSGGPVVNEKGELIGVVSQGTTGQGDQQVIDHSVHVREVRRALEGIQQPGGNALTLTAAVDSLGFDSFFVPVKKGARVKADLKGKGTTDLDLFVKDVDNFRKARFGDKEYNDYQAPVQEAGPTDQEHGAFVADWTGVCLIQVQNVGAPKTKGNEYTLSVEWENRVKAPLTFLRRLAARGTDTVQLQYEAGKGKARVTVRGDGDTDLDAEVLDPKGAVVVRGQPGTDYHELTWLPAVSGSYTVRIRNAGNIWNGYVLTTD
jgi:S1-C subfamily serine protease